MLLLRLSLRLAHYADDETDDRTTAVETARIVAEDDHGIPAEDFRAFLSENAVCLDGVPRIPVRRLAWWLGY